jgi:hypothetical protein
MHPEHLMRLAVFQLDEPTQFIVVENHCGNSVASALGRGKSID